MDVGDPSNFERLAWFFRDRDLRHAGIHAQRVDDATIRARIREGEARYAQVFCPHTACAVELLAQRRARGDVQPLLLVATAHPAKFDSVVEPLVGHSVPPPPALAELLTRPEHSEPLPADVEALRARLQRGFGLR
jgi:threonine synthase